jgi:hypothetical protein
MRFRSYLQNLYNNYNILNKFQQKVITYSPSSCEIRASKVALLRGSFRVCLPAMASISSINTKQGACRKKKEYL